LGKNGLCESEIGKMGKRTGNPRGRPRGAKSSRTVEREQQMREAAVLITQALGDTAFDGDAHELLMAVYKDTAHPLLTRIDAAKAAIAYEKPRLQAIQGGDADKPIRTVGELVWLDSSASE
jgi:hypothetical protein